MTQKRRGSRILVPGEARNRGGLILPGGPPTRAPHLLVPRGYESEDVVLVGKCHVCDATFHRGEEDEWQRHVGKCAREHIDEIREHSLRRRMPIFDEDTWDPEIAAHMRDVGRRMLEEGRLEVKPSERAGFS